MKKIIQTLFIFSLGVESVSAQINTAVVNGEKVYQNVITNLFSPLLKLAMVITFLYFLFGGVKFLFAMNSGGSEEDLRKGKLHLLWGLIGLFIVFSIGGILSFLNGIFGNIFTS